MNYREMTDFEINARVHFGGMKNFNVSGEYCSFIGPDGDTYGIGPYHYKKNLPDYCKSWADAGPIIAENRISLDFDSDGNDTPQNAWCRASSPCGQVWYGQVSVPLRAAMIVYLMMQEGNTK